MKNANLSNMRLAFDFNIEELKSKLDENIKTLLKTHLELDEFTLDKIVMQ